MLFCPSCTSFSTASWSWTLIFWQLTTGLKYKWYLIATPSLQLFQNKIKSKTVEIVMIKTVIWLLFFLFSKPEFWAHPYIYFFIKLGNFWILKVFICAVFNSASSASSLAIRRCNHSATASECQWHSCNSPRYNPSILRHNGIWVAVDEAVLNKELKNLGEKKISASLFWRPTFTTYYNLLKVFPNEKLFYMHDSHET